MTHLRVPLLLAALWIALTGEWSVANLAAGAALGVAAARLTVPARSRSGRRLRVGWALLRFPVTVVWELVLANLRVARTVLFTPRDRLTPGIIAIPLSVASDVEVTALANLITLTPGTVTLDVSDDRRTLFVHALDLADPEAVLASIKDFERGIQEIHT